MAQQHLDRLTAVDASFLHNEGDASHMHVGGNHDLRGPAARYRDFLDHIRGRLHLVPRYRQRLAIPPLETGRPVWADDPNFNLEYHVRHSALPEPGSEEQLLLLAARIFSQRLDRSKPLWETWFVEGLENNRFAMISKTHHALIDGIAGVDLLTVLFDLSPVPQEVEAPRTAWEPAPEPSTTDLVAAGLRGLVKTARRSSAGRASAATHPERAVGNAREAVEGVSEIVWAGLNPAPETPLNVSIGPHRRIGVVRNELADFKRIKDALGGTVNDVVLTIVAGALRRWLHSRGVRTEGLELRGLVPVSIRTEAEKSEGGNRIAAMRGPLPVYIADPVARLRFVRQEMDGLKESKQALGAEVIAGVQRLRAADDARPGLAHELLHAAVQPHRHERPGPAVPPLRARARAPGPLPGRLPAREPRAGGRDHVLQRPLNFGLLADYDALPDLDVILEGLVESREELLDVARQRERDLAEQPA